MDMIRQKRKREAPYAVPRWWLDEVVRRFAARGIGQVDAAARLSQIANRKPPWLHSSVSRFLSGQHVTEELVKAFATFLDMPMPVYTPRDLAEALAFQQATRGRSPSSGDTAPGVVESAARRDARLEAADSRLSAELAEVRTQRRRAAIQTDHGASGKPKRGGAVSSAAATRRS
jgi:hypothetical protein